MMSDDSKDRSEVLAAVQERLRRGRGVEEELAEMIGWAVIQTAADQLKDDIFLAYGNFYTALEAGADVREAETNFRQKVAQALGISG
jgi:hypothetical protein